MAWGGRSAGAEIAKRIICFGEDCSANCFSSSSRSLLFLLRFFNAAQNKRRGGTLSRERQGQSRPLSALSEAFIRLLPFERPATTVLKREEEWEDQSAVRFVLVPAASIASILTVAGEQAQMWRLKRGREREGGGEQKIVVLHALQLRFMLPSL